MPAGPVMVPIQCNRLSDSGNAETPAVLDIYGRAGEMNVWYWWWWLYHQGHEFILQSMSMINEDG